MIWNQQTDREEPSVALPSEQGEESTASGGGADGENGPEPSAEETSKAGEESSGEAGAESSEEADEESSGEAVVESSGEAGVESSGEAGEASSGEAGTESSGGAGTESSGEAETGSSEGADAVAGAELSEAESTAQTGAETSTEEELQGSGSAGGSVSYGPFPQEFWTGDGYVIGEAGETQFVFDAEPETEYFVGTPGEADLGTAAPGMEETASSEEKPAAPAASKTYKKAAGAVAKTAQTAVENATPALKTLGFNIVNAVLIMIIGIQIARLLRMMIRKTFEKLHLDNSLRAFLSSVVYALTIGVSGFMALERLGVSTASIITILGSAGLAISLSLQDFLANFAGGMIILVLKPFRPGDYIVCGSAEGTVVSTSLFYTTLDTVDNRQMILPNGALSNANIINVTAEPRRRLEIRVDISYSSDIRRAKDILRQLFDAHPDILHEEDVVVFVDSLGESGITLVARGWIPTEKYWPAKWQITEDLKYAYDRAGIEIPFRQVVVHMQDGENGNRP